MKEQNTNKESNFLPSTEAHKALVIIDPGVEDYQNLVAGVIPGSQVIVLDDHRDGVAQITEALQNSSDIAEIHIVSHGSPGCLYLGNSQLSLDTLKGYAEQLRTWVAPELLLYGCNVAAGDAGEEFISKLHALTGANIAASAQRTGSAAKGGDWQLEVVMGQLSSALAFKPEVMATYQGVLVTVLDFEGIGNGVSVGNFYDTDPQDFDITFSDNALALVDIDAGGTGNFGGEPSPDTTMAFIGGGAATMNVLNGFSNGFSVFYSSPFATGEIRIYDDFNGTGNLITTIQLSLTPANGEPDPTGVFSPFVEVAAMFDGVAKSVAFAGANNLIGFDNITFFNQAPVAVDDTATTDEDTATTFDVLGNDTDVDGDILTVSSFDTTGTVGTVTDNGDGTFSYDPNGQFESLNDGDVATDSFTYTVSDGTVTDTATVNITINGADEPLNLVGTNQKDTLTGGGNNDTISGGNAPDELFGGGGDDIIGGGGEDNGSDIINGGTGNDTLTGGNGADVFVFAPGDGSDTITDFSTPDVIGLAGGLSFADLSFSGSDVIVTSTNEVLATLVGVDATTLTSSDFITV